MTDEEYNTLDELWTNTTPKVNFSRPGVFARQQALVGALDKVAANYILSRAEATGQTPAEIIGKMVRREIAAEA